MALKSNRVKRVREEAPELTVASSSSQLDRDALLASCAVFRVMNGAAVAGKTITLLRRSDVVEVLKCKFGVKELTKALAHFESYFTNPLTKLRFQAWMSSTQLIHNVSGEEVGDAVSIFARDVLKKNALTLKVCDLSRNRFVAGDVPLLLGAQGLNISFFDNLELLDFSYNPIGNAGACQLFQLIRSNKSIRAVILKHCNVDDEGACIIGDMLRDRPRPEHNQTQKATALYLKDEIKLMFFVNLNGNRIGAHGTRRLAYRLPDFVSLTVIQQFPLAVGGTQAEQTVEELI